ncbi:MAG: hypothetical protein L0Y66_01465 [Myxococcaceae bacterium]|nr:hypothetical protein [Myxococcaceae bacterium]MCI0669798.1 hypothetical protein [Myxococcaceae bacterium]
MLEQEIHTGMRVWASDGHYVGNVREVGDIDFEVDCGGNAAHDVRVDFGDVVWLDDVDVVLKRRRESLQEVPHHREGLPAFWDPVLA